MADLRVNFAAIESPNPFWLASGPPTNTAGQVMRAFDAGWGGAVWKTIGEPIVNTSSRYGAIDYNGAKVMGFNNIELISDRPTEVNIREIAEVKKRYREKSGDCVADGGIQARELARDGAARRRRGRGRAGTEFRMPARDERARHGFIRGASAGIHGDDHGLGEGSRENAGDREAHAQCHGHHARRAGRGKGRRRRRQPDQYAQFDHGRGSGNVFAEAQCGREILARRILRAGDEADRVAPGFQRRENGEDPDRRELAESDYWNDAAEHIALGASITQVCTAAMHYGFRIVEDMIDGLSAYMDDHGFRTIEDFRGRAVPNVKDWGDLDLNYKMIADIRHDLCIGCQLCYVACEDGAHQCIEPYTVAGNGKKNPNGMGVHVPRIIEDECVGCNLCALVCPVDQCITMKQIDTGLPFESWKMRVKISGRLSSLSGF